MFKIIKDLDAFSCGGGVSKKIGIMICNPCFHSVCIFRLSQMFHRLHLNPIAKVIWYLNRVLFNVDIDYRADIAGGLRIVHGLGIVIGSNVKSFGRLTIYQGVTIGGTGKTAVYQGKVIDQPVLMDNVTLYTDSKVFGPVFIGENTVVKAGRIITKNINV